jgi:class 3 adenylate cyclase/HAMP domain-containing protein
MAVMTASASAVAWYAFIGIDRAVTGIIDDSVVGMAASLRLAEKSAEIAATAPALIASGTDAARAHEQNKLIERVKELVSVTESLNAQGVDPDRIRFLTIIEGEITAELEKLNAAVTNRLRYSDLRGKAVSELADIHNRFLNRLTPMVDDATFTLILSSEEVMSESTLAINGLVEGGVSALQQILTINAEGNLAAGLLNEAANIGDPTLIQPIRERFLASAAKIDRSLKQLADSGEKDNLQKANADLLELGTGEDNLFAAREHELRALAKARESLQARREQMTRAVNSSHDVLLEILTPIVDDAAFALVLSSEDVTAQSTEAINGLVEGGINTLYQLMTIKSEGILAASLMNQASNTGDPTLIQPVRERYNAAAAAIERGLDELPDSVEKKGLGTAANALLEIGAKEDKQGFFDIREQELRAPSSERPSLEARRELMARTVEPALEILLDTLTPMVDDATFELIIKSEEITADSTEAINGLVEGGVNTLHRVLAINAEANLAAGLLNEAAHVDHATLIQPVRERFLAAAAAISRNLRQLPDSPEKEELRQANTSLTEIGVGRENLFDTRERELRAIAKARESLQVKREEMAGSVNDSHDTLLKILTPMVDDAGFELVLTSEDVTSRSTEAINGLIEGGVNTLRVLLTLRAKANLAAGLLNEAAGIPDPSFLQPLRERFIAATGHIEKLVAEIPDDVDDGELGKLANALIEHGRAEVNIFDLRRGELLQVAAAEASLDANRVLGLKLGEEVAKLVTSAQQSSDAAAIHSARAISSGKFLLLLITAISAAGAAAIVLYYVAPRIVKPLENITRAMSDLAGGDTTADIPYRDRGDEIGMMAQALGVFRDITIEVQESNMRDIQQARRRLADAIESITEGFSLYDSEDRLVVCNQRYRTLLYPDMADEIVPGMYFEEIIRSAAGKGYVKDAEGRVDEWVEARLASHREPGEPQMQRRGAGQWLLISERRTDDGGTVAVYSDITEMKQREEELAEKSAALENLSGKLAKYLSPQIYESIFSGAQEAGIASKRKKLTVFFSDIASFTETTDKLESEELTQLLNHYLTEMSRIALDHGATIDKYVGDAIVIFFGDPESRGVKEDALACVEMAIAMRERMLELQDVWRDSGIQNPLKCRIGINTGYCTVGTFGSEDRMDYTIVGGGVNLASRLETSATPGEILISYETYAHVKDKIRCEESGPINVKGIAYPVETYRVIDLYDNLAAERNIIREDMPNMNIDFNLGTMTTADRRKAAGALKRVLKELSEFEKTNGNVTRAY